MTDFFDYFTHGSSYSADFNDKIKDEPRSKCCNSCAFTNCKGTVRPKDISLDYMMKNGDFFDVFYCHDKDADGNYKICKSWHKHFGELCLPRHEQANKEIEEILNS